MSVPPDVAIETVPAGTERNRYLTLFRLADDSDGQIFAYYQTGTLYGLVQGRIRVPVGHVLVTPTADLKTVELKSVAIAEDWQGQGLGRYLVTGVLKRLRDGAVSTVIVGTSNASLYNLAFYQKLGFRMLRIERDYFSPSKGYDADFVENGIAGRDMVWLDMQLSPPQPAYSQTIES